MIDSLAAAGFTVSHAQLERWRAFGLLPRHERRYRGRGKGSSSSATDAVTALAEVIAERVCGTRPLQEVALRIFFERPDIALTESVLKASIEWYVDRRIHSAHRKVADVLADVGTVTEDDEDRAAQRIIDHYKKLDKQTRTTLEQAFPGMADFALGATLGQAAVGVDRLVEIIDQYDPGGHEPIATAFRTALRDQDAGPPALSPAFVPQIQKAAVAATPLAEIVATRDLLLSVGTRVRLLNLLRLLLPESEIVADLHGEFEGTFVLRPFLGMYPATRNQESVWDVETKTLVMLLTLPDAMAVFRVVGDLVTLPAPILDELLKEAREVLTSTEPEDGATGGARR